VYCKLSFQFQYTYSVHRRLRTRLFVKIPRPRDSEVTFSQSLSQAATCYYQSNHSKVEAIP